MSHAYREAPGTDPRVNAAVARVALRLTKARRDAGVTQEKAARAIGVSHSAISKFENGHSDMTLSHIIGYALALKINLADLFADD